MNGALIDGKILHKTDVDALVQIHEIKELRDSIVSESEWFDKLGSINVPESCPPLSMADLLTFKYLLMNNVNGKCIKSLNNPSL